MKAKDIALILVVVVLVAFTPNSPISVLARDVLADARPAPLSASPVGTAFTYQGELTDGGDPADGLYDFQFKLWDAETSGGQIGSPIARGDVVVAGGIFTVELDFGASAFAGEARWLEIGVRPGDSTGSYTTLDPRQKITPTPYALYASNADTLDGQHGSAFATSAHNHWGQTWSGTGDGLTASSSNGNAVVGLSSAGSGLHYGVYGMSASTSGDAVVGWAQAATGSTAGVVGRSDSPSGKGVNGYTTAATGGVGVFGEASATSGGTAGVEGVSHATDGGAGVYGIGAASSGNVYGIYGWSQSTGGTGAFGYSTAASGATIGVRGRSDSTSGWGGLFDSLGNGVLAKAPASGNIFEGRQYPSDTVKFSVSGAGNVHSYGNLTVDGTSETQYLKVNGPLDVLGSHTDMTGSLTVHGNLHVDGHFTGTFPAPAWDSGWVALSAGEFRTLTHSVGGDTSDYFVDLQCKDGSGKINDYVIGTNGRITSESQGADYFLDATTIELFRGGVDGWCPTMRARIWVIN
jgi:hypothetical protein